MTVVALLGSAYTFWLYALLTVGAWVFTYFLAPETKGRTLEQIQEFWRRQEPTMQHLPVRQPPLVEPGDGRPVGV